MIINAKIFDINWGCNGFGNHIADVKSPRTKTTTCVTVSVNVAAHLFIDTSYHWYSICTACIPVLIKRSLPFYMYLGVFNYVQCMFIAWLKKDTSCKTMQET